MKNKIYVYSINPLNFIFCLVLRIKYKIIYDRSENVNKKLLCLFQNINDLVELQHIKRNEVSSYAFENVRKIKKHIKINDFFLINKKKIL